MFPHRFGSRQSDVFQLQPLQGPLPSAAEVPQVSAACQRGEQGKESPGGPAAAGTRGKQEGAEVSPRRGSIPMFVFLTGLSSVPHILILSNPILP